MGCSPLDSSVHGIFQARILERVVISYSRVIPDPGIEPVSLASPALAGEFFTTNTTWEAPFKVFIEFIIILLLLYVLVFWP